MISREDSAGSGRRRRRRIAGEVAGGRRLGMSSGKMLQGSRGRMGWCRRRRRRWRFLWTHRGGTGWTVAAVICVGDDELRSGVLGRGSRGRGREQRVRERSEELRGVVVASPGGAGEAGGGAGACSAAVRCPPPLPTGKGRW